MLKMSQWVERTPAGVLAWREEALSPIDRQLLTLLREPHTVRQISEALREGDLAVVERLVGGLVRRGWVLVADGLAATPKVAAVPREENGLSPLQALLRRHSTGSAAGPPPSPAAPDPVSAFLPAAPELAAAPPVPEAAKVLPLLEPQDAFPGASRKSSPSPADPPPSFEENWNNPVSDEASVALLLEALSSGVVVDQAEEAAQSQEASSPDAFEALQDAFRNPVRAPEDKEPEFVGEVVDEEAVAALAAAIAGTGSAAAPDEGGLALPVAPEPVVEMADLASLMGVNLESPSEEDGEGSGGAAAPVAVSRPRSKMAEQLLKSMESGGPRRPGMRQVQAQKEQVAEMRKQQARAQEEVFAAQRDREKAQQKMTTHALTEALRQKKLAREKKGDA